MTVEAACDGKREYFSWDSSRPEGLLEKEANNGFEIKVKVSTEGWEYDKLNLMFNSSFSQKANLYKIEF